MIDLEAIKARLNRLADITETGRMNRDVIAEFLTHGPSDILDLLSLADRYGKALSDIAAHSAADADYAVKRANEALEEA